MTAAFTFEQPLRSVLEFGLLTKTAQVALVDNDAVLTDGDDVLCVTEQTDGGETFNLSFSERGITHEMVFE